MLSSRFGDIVGTFCEDYTTQFVTVNEATKRVQAEAGGGACKCWAYCIMCMYMYNETYKNQYCLVHIVFQW